MTSEQKPKLEQCEFEFYQDMNCMDKGDFERIKVKARADLGIDGSAGAFYTIQTEGWSFDTLDELKELIERIEKSIKK